MRPERVRRDGDGLAVTTGRGLISVLAPGPFDTRFPTATPRDVSAAFAAYRVSVRDLGLVRDLLDGNSVPSVRRDETLQILPDDLFGIALEFAEASVGLR